MTTVKVPSSTYTQVEGDVFADPEYAYRTESDIGSATATIPGTAGIFGFADVGAELVPDGATDVVVAVKLSGVFNGHVWYGNGGVDSTIAGDGSLSLLDTIVLTGLAAVRSLSTSARQYLKFVSGNGIYADAIYAEVTFTPPVDGGGDPPPDDPLPPNPFDAGALKADATAEQVIAYIEAAPEWAFDSDPAKGIGTASTRAAQAFEYGNGRHARLWCQVGLGLSAAAGLEVGAVLDTLATTLGVPRP